MDIKFNYYDELLEIRQTIIDLNKLIVESDDSLTKLELRRQITILREKELILVQKVNPEMPHGNLLITN